MIRKIKLIILIFGLSFGNNVFPKVSSSTSFDRSLRGLAFEIEKEMASGLESKLQKVLGNQNFWMTLHLSFDKARIRRDFLALEQKYQRSKNPSRGGKNYSDLPGLPMGRNGAPIIKDDNQKIVVISDGPELTRSFVLSYVNDVFVEVAIDKENERKAQSALRKLVEEYFKELHAPVKLKFNRRKIAGLVPTVVEIEGEKNNEEKLGTTEIKLDTKGLARDMGEFFVPSMFDTIEKRYLKTALIFFASMAFLGLISLFLVIYTSRRSAKKNIAQFDRMIKEMSNALSTLSFGSGAGTDLAATADEQKKMDPIQEKDSEIMSQIKSMLEKSPQLVGYLLKFFLKEGHFENAFLLIQSIGPEYLAWLKKEIPEELFLEFVVDLRENGDIYFATEHRLKALRSLYAQIWQASLNITNLHHEEMREKLKAMESADAFTLLAACSMEEASVVLELLPARVLANLISQGRITPEALGRPATTLVDKELLRGIIAKINGISGGTASNRDFFLEKVGEYLPLEEERRLLMSAGMPMGFHILDLAHEYESVFLSEALSLSLDDLAAFLGVLNQELQDKIISHLPEIKARRLEQRVFEVGARGLQLKSRITSRLKKEHSTERWSEYRRFLKERSEGKKHAQMQDRKVKSISEKRKAA